MNSNDATVTTAYDSTDSTATSRYEGSKPITDLKPVSDCCRCNDKGSCRHCRCVKAGNICTNCLLLQHSHCMNNKHIRNKFLKSNTTTISNEFNNVLPNLLAIWTPPHANQITQSAASHAFTFSKLFPTVILYLIAFGVRKSVAVDAADVWELEKLALIGYRFGAPLHE